MVDEVLGLDIGGANLKAATTSGVASSRPFALWKHPERLVGEMQGLLHALPPFARLAVTMTGELCDCYETKRQGVNAILNAVESAAGSSPILVWQTPGNFSDVATARLRTLQVAAANWLALATFAGRFAREGGAILIDVGSTTSDIIPMWQGRPTARNFTDTERLLSGELVYTGVRRTPVCALLGSDGMAEFFATMQDVNLTLGRMPENENDNDTADGRPATRRYALARLARMMGGDIEITPEPVIVRLAEMVADRQHEILRKAALNVASRLPDVPSTVILSGSGEFLATWVASSAFGNGARYVSLSRQIGAEVSQASCAYAVAVLAKEMNS
ncbi:MAG TPA: hydantoinase/oxoprolinase family protein [Gemmataceae bacterium]|nr:hydantoinase/oxoprolinase family protein [Gemmataceae bacterium]